MFPTPVVGESLRDWLINNSHADPGWTGSETDYIARDLELAEAETEPGGPWLDVVLPPVGQMTLTMSLRMRMRAVALPTPWFDPTSPNA